MAEKASKMLAPFQLGIDVKGGCEALIGSFQYVMKKIQAVRDNTIQLPLIKDPHSRIVLLRSCFSLTMVMFLLKVH